MKKILLIEDDQKLRQNTLEILELFDFQVTGAKDGKEGVVKALHENPDIILCDIMMPEMNGYEVISTIRKSDNLKNTPFIFLTAKATMDDLREGMNLGADDYLTKPVKRDELIKAIDVRLKKREQELNELNNKMSEFTSVFNRTSSHEWNTPLHGILAPLAFLQSHIDDIDKDQTHHMIDIIYESANRMKRLIENTLIFQSIISGNNREEKNISITKFNNAKAASIKTEAEKIAKLYQRPDDLQLHIDNAELNADKRDFIKIVTEIIDNAFKFSKPGSIVDIRTSVNESRYQITVSDEGRGMTPEQIESIGPFIQFDRNTYEQQGCGLGLFIVKNLADLDNVDVAIDSVPGKGTKVKIISNLFIA